MKEKIIQGGIVNGVKMLVCRLGKRIFRLRFIRPEAVLESA